MDATELSGTQDVIWIREKRRYPQRSSGRTHLSIGGVDFALEWISAAIGEDKLNLQLTQALIAVALGLKKPREIDVGLFGDVKVHLDRIDGRDSSQLTGAWADEVANLPGGDACGAIDW